MAALVSHGVACIAVTRYAASAAWVPERDSSTDLRVDGLGRDVLVALPELHHGCVGLPWRGAVDVLGL